MSKQDLKTSLERLVKLPSKTLTEENMTRLMHLLSFYRTDTLQPSDFDRLLADDVSPLVSAAQGDTKAQFQRSLGGALARSSTFEWKASAVRQLGLVFSRNHGAPSRSFKAAANGGDRVNFAAFKSFIEQQNALEGFNITHDLLLKLFGELDPHSKTHLTLRDWESAFGAFDEIKMMLTELKNYMLL